ncbi:hypothetical protein EDC94DRAFT_600348 [Helicostylum pulchrum]|nr:hypothetical protein EDC94DRAFT_600348 [Helicostylum pulchrum]
MLFKVCGPFFFVVFYPCESFFLVAVYPCKSFFFWWWKLSGAFVTIYLSVLGLLFGLLLVLWLFVYLFWSSCSGVSYTSFVVGFL